MNETRVHADQLLELTSELLVRSGCTPADAGEAARSLVWADLHGRPAQGVFRLPILLDMLRRGVIVSPSDMKWNEQAVTMHHLDAGGGFGQTAGSLAMRKAIDVARIYGMGSVTVSNSNHYGAAGYFCAMAAEANCIGLTSTNATPKVAPQNGASPILGTNPIAFGCPGPEADPFLADLSTSAIAGSTVREIRARGGRLPEGVALDNTGAPTTDPSAVDGGTLLPAAGPKGFALGLMAEILCGILSGGAMSFEIGNAYVDSTRHGGVSHFFLAIDLTKSRNARPFRERMLDLVSALRSCAVASDAERVRYPGEIRSEFAAAYRNEGIPLHPDTAKSLLDIAAGYGVDNPSIENLRRQTNKHLPEQQHR